MHFDPDNPRIPVHGRVFSVQLAEVYLPAIAVLVVGDSGRYAFILNASVEGYNGHFGGPKRPVWWAHDVGKKIWGLEAMASVWEHWTISICGGVILGTNRPVSPPRANFITQDFFVWTTCRHRIIYDAWEKEKGQKKRQCVQNGW